jgi:NAD(P)-dependent dehydrogenase (short-subunit alcohol dehydrogenase family)
MSTADSKTVLITGAAGAIGLAAVSTFLETGMTVVGIDKSPSMPSADGNDRYIGLTADLTDEGSVVAGLDLLADVPELRHVVGIAGGALPGEPESQHDPSLIDLSRITGTEPHEPVHLAKGCPALAPQAKYRRQIGHIDFLFQCTGRLWDAGILGR